MTLNSYTVKLACAYGVMLLATSCRDPRATTADELARAQLHRPVTLDSAMMQRVILALKDRGLSPDEVDIECVDGDERRVLGVIARAKAKGYWEYTGAKEANAAGTLSFFYARPRPTPGMTVWDGHVYVMVDGASDRVPIVLSR